jgi:cell division protein FtsI (penicillin-binding protein 3)
MKNLDPARARWIRVRVGVLSGLMAVALGVVVSTAFRVQVEDAAPWRDLAERQRQRRLHVQPKRGSIVDRNGVSLAVSIEVPSASIDVGELIRGIEMPGDQASFLRESARALSQALTLDEAELLAKMQGRPRFLWLKRRITSDEAAALRALGDGTKRVRPIRGIAIDGEGQRYYPARELGSNLLGFVAPDGFGKEGIELSLDEELRGRPEEVRGLRDRSGRLIFAEGTTDERAHQGAEVVLSIDSAIQHVAQRELDAAMRTYETKSASLVMVDPTTGEVLAMASSPGYNPNDYGKSDPEARRNRALVDRFEPGSTMKVFTVAGALAAGTLKPVDQIFCERGSYQLGNVTIHDTHVSEWLTPTQVLAKSSNIGALKIGLGLGEAGLYSTLRRFGFGESTGLGLPGESSGVLRPKARPWFEVETANASFGQGIGITTMQLAMAMAAIANHGKLLEPTLVKKMTDSAGQIVRESHPRVRQQAVPGHIARMIADMLVAVTEPGGTGVEAAVPGFRVAGKTATAQKVDPLTGKYAADKFTASFMGFVPAERPRIVVAIVLDEPTIGRYGGDLAGPVFRRVAESTLRYLGVTPMASTPKIAEVKQVDDPAVAALAGMRPAFVDSDPSTSLPVPPVPEGTPAVEVPNTTRLLARQAVVALTQAGFVPRVEGVGRIVRQLPAPGTLAPKGTTVRLLLEPPS